MSPDDANPPPDRAVQNKLVHNCDKCQAAMKQLAELPALSVHAAIRVFRCYVCNHVVAERT